MIVIGIESSCDETAVAVVDDKKNILNNKLFSQSERHNQFGGVIPEIAARSHLELLPFLFQEALIEISLSLKNIDAIAVTAGPGLIGGIIVGMMFAKGIASTANKPFIAINHLEGHALTARLIYDLPFPYLMLLMSGGHCQILIAYEAGQYEKLGETLDDAIGEAFDKVAKILGLGYPGGPLIEKLAKTGNPFAFQFPKPICDQDNCNFSFSGLKTAVRNQILKLSNIDTSVQADICASLQYSITKILLVKLQKALAIFKERCPQSQNVVIAGGVAANRYIYNSLKDCLSEQGYQLYAPPSNLCTDNAAMIAWAGIEKLKLGTTNNLDFAPKSRWPLTEL